MQSKFQSTVQSSPESSFYISKIADVSKTMTGLEGEAHVLYKYFYYTSIANLNFHDLNVVSLAVLAQPTSHTSGESGKG